MSKQENQRKFPNVSGELSQTTEDKPHKIMRAVPATILLVLSVASWFMYFNFYYEWNSERAVHWLPLSALLTISTVTIIWLQNKWFIPKNISPFNLWIFGITIIGGSISFLLPLAIADNFSKDGEGTALRQMLIYSTGGLLGVITLGETRRKNDQEKEKNENDHTRQVHAERRSRYTKAIEQLANEKAVIRSGGVYTLIGLVDEWLTDNTLMPEEQQKEGQVIVNNLCAYIRSSFPLAKKQDILDLDHEPAGYIGDFATERATLYEEQELRLSILAEIKKRLNGGLQADQQRILRVQSGPWSNFDYNFSNTNFFYPVDFSLCNFNSSLLFTDSHFDKYGRFSDSVYNGATRFSGSVFQEGAEFYGSIFKYPFYAHNAQFMNDTDFSATHFMQGGSFLDATFMRSAFFFKAIFDKYPTAFFNTAFYNNCHLSDIKINEELEFTIFIFQTNKTARFSISADASKYAFKPAVDSLLKIETEQITVADGRVFTIPVGCELFDPEPLPAPKPEEPTE